MRAGYEVKVVTFIIDCVKWSGLDVRAYAALIQKNQCAL